MKVMVFSYRMGCIWNEDRQRRRLFICIFLDK